MAIFNGHVELPEGTSQDEDIYVTYATFLIAI